MVTKLATVRKENQCTAVTHPRNSACGLIVAMFISETNMELRMYSM
jgi:hypothetical protein